VKYPGFLEDGFESDSSTASWSEDAEDCNEERQEKTEVDRETVGDHASSSEDR
jgi:hypothetical protein